MSFSSSSISKISSFMKMPQDVRTKIKILMKIHKATALQSLWERPHKNKICTASCNQAQSKMIDWGSPFYFFPLFFPLKPEFLHIILIYWRQFDLKFGSRFYVGGGIASGLNSISTLDLQKFCITVTVNLISYIPSRRQTASLL